MNQALKIGKLAFTWAVVGMTIAWSVGLSMLVQPLAAKAATCPTLSSGDLFKVAGNSAVYLLNANKQRLYFPNADVYYSWFPDYSGIVEIDSSCLVAYPQPSVPPYGVNWRTGSRLVKLQISPDVYAVEPGNKLSKVGSESVAAALYGSDWNRKVVDVSDYFWPNYTNRGSEITESKPHEGQLIKVGSNGSVWYVSNGSKMSVDGSVRGDVRVVTQAVADAVSTGSGSVTAASIYTNPSQGIGGGSSVPSTPVVGGGSLTVSRASDSPMSSFALKNAARVPFTKVVLTAGSSDVTIDSLMVRRAGAPAADSDFATVNLVDASGNLLNDSGKSFNSTHEATFTEDIVIPANSSKTYTIVGDMADVSTGNGNVPVLELESVTLVGGGSVSGLPVAGYPVTINQNISVGTVTLAQGTTVGDSTKELGSKDVDLASLKVTVAINDFQVSRAVFYNSGTASDGDFGNFKIKYNNNVIGTGSMKSKYVSFDLASCTADCLITKNNNRTYSVSGDVVNGSGRTMNLDVQRTVHVLVRDLTNNVYVTPENNASAMTNTITVSTGRLAISKTNDVAAADVPSNTSDVKLATFNFKVTGEPIDVRTLSFRVTTGGTVTPAGIDSLTLYDASGKALIGGQDVTRVGSTAYGYVTSSDAFTLPVGDNVLTVKAKIDSSPADGDTVVVDVDMNSTNNFDARGTTTGDTVTLGTYANPTGYVTGNTMTIRTAQLRITTLSTPASATYAGGSTDLICANVLFDAAGSSEDIRVTQVKVEDNVSSGAKTQDLQNIRLFVDKDGDSYNGAGTQVALSNTQSGSDSDANDDETITFNLSGADQFVVKSGKKLVVTVKCNLSGGASTGTHNLRTNTASQVSLVGVNSGNTVTAVADSAGGQNISVGTAGGTVQVSIDASNVTSKNYAAGSQGVTLASFNFYATTTEDIDVQKIYFTQRVTDTNSAAYQDYDLLFVTDASGNVLGSVVPTSTKPVISLNSRAFLVRTNSSSGQILYLKANLATIAPQGTVTAGGHNLGFNITAIGDITAKGAQSGSNAVVYFGSSVPSGNTHYAYKSVPTVTVLPVSNSTLANGTNELFRLSVTANSGDISVYKFTFDITTTTASVSALQFVDVTDSPEVQLYSTSTAVQNIPVIASIFLDPNSQCGTAQCLQGGSERVIAAGTTRTYVLRGTVSGVATGATVSTRLIGDNAAQSNVATIMSSANTVESRRPSNFIWSDRSAGAHATTTADWTNGYLVTGLNAPSSTPATVSK